MCTGACSKFIAIPLYILALVSIICNVILFFPDFKTEFASEDREGQERITMEVKYMGGVVGGGIMILIPAIHIHLTSAKNCCANRCGMFLSIGFAAVGVVGAIYNLSVAALGLSNGPLCYWSNPSNPKPQWGTPFANSSGSYLSDKESWAWCELPDNVVEFNVWLFSILLVAGCLQGIFCTIQMVNGLFGCICGTCSGKEVRPEMDEETAKILGPALGDITGGMSSSYVVSGEALQMSMAEHCRGSCCTLHLKFAKENFDDPAEHENITPTVKRDGGSSMVWTGCTAPGPGALME
ncbi:transmembrane 4 L6 family member 5 [Xenentodon cancila]